MAVHGFGGWHDILKTFSFKIPTLYWRLCFLTNFPVYWELWVFTNFSSILGTFEFPYVLGTLSFYELSYGTGCFEFWQTFLLYCIHWIFTNSSCTGDFEFLRFPSLYWTCFLTSFPLYWGLWVCTRFSLYQRFEFLQTFSMYWKLCVLTSFHPVVETLSFKICHMPCKNKVLFCTG